MELKLLDMVRRESSVSLGALLFFAAVSAVANAALLIIVNAAIHLEGEEHPTFRLLSLFVLSLTIFALTRRHLMATVAREFEQILHRIRMRLTEKIRRTELLSLEKLGPASIYATIQRDILQISSVGKPLVTVFQSLLLLALTLIYILQLSQLAFAYAAGIIIGTTLLYLARRRYLGRSLRGVLRHEGEVFESLQHVLNGIKELQLNLARSNDLIAHTKSRSEKAKDLRVRIEGQFVSLSVFAQTAIYIGLGTLVFVLPRLYSADDDGVIATNVTVAFIFLIGPVFTSVGMIPDLYQADAAVSSIYEVESRLDEALLPSVAQVPETPPFEKITLEEVCFQFHDERSAHPFTVGPIDLTLSSGEVLFLTGGNGSGKSTLLKILTALYRPERGSLTLDGTDVTSSRASAYQSLFSTVFSDFHLFDRLYGLDGLDPDRIEALLADLELTGKTRATNGEFETLDLSTGQRKRLALLVALLEDRPILVFDEWAAEQDPEFRKKFYHEIIPRLRAEGKTVVAVTHDERYFRTATRVLRMEEGRLSQYTEAELLSADGENRPN